MKKILMRFTENLLSKQQMKSVKGGGGYRCWCSGAMSSCFTTGDKSAALSICSGYLGGDNCHVSTCG